MGFKLRGVTRRFFAGGMLLALFAVVSTEPVPLAEGYGVMSDGRSAFGLARPHGPTSIRLAEMEQREDSVVYRTDGKDREYLQRQRDERDKEKKSWNMLNNVIIDGRQPPRRFSDPRVSNPPQ